MLGLVVRVCYIGALLMGLCHGQGGKLKRSQPFSNEQIKQIVDRHNRLRKSVGSSNMKILSWDGTLADLAQRQAEKCDATNRPTSERVSVGPFVYVGENHAWGNGSSLPDVALVADAWSGERRSYTYGRPFPKGCRANAVCGHYTQMVWADTCKIGCGAASCDFIANGRGVTKGYIMFCNYGPGGNIDNQLPYEKGPACRDCSDKTGCAETGLCGNSDCPIAGATTTTTKTTTISTTATTTTTQRPRTTTPEATVTTTRPVTRTIGPVTRFTGISSDQCVNQHPLCPYWALIGECYNNPEWMASACRGSCLMCPKVTLAGGLPCRDYELYDGECRHWAHYGKCEASDSVFYMSWNCRASCGLCSQNTYGHKTPKQYGSAPSTGYGAVPYRPPTIPVDSYQVYAAQKANVLAPRQNTGYSGQPQRPSPVAAPAGPVRAYAARGQPPVSAYGQRSNVFVTGNHQAPGYQQVNSNTYGRPRNIGGYQTRPNIRPGRYQQNDESNVHSGYKRRQERRPYENELNRRNYNTRQNSRNLQSPNPSAGGGASFIQAMVKPRANYEHSQRTRPVYVAIPLNHNDYGSNRAAALQDAPLISAEVEQTEKQKETKKPKPQPAFVQTPPRRQQSEMKSENPESSDPTLATTENRSRSRREAVAAVPSHETPQNTSTVPDDADSMDMQREQRQRQTEYEVRYRHWLHQQQAETQHHEEQQASGEAEAREVRRHELEFHQHLEHIRKQQQLWLRQQQRQQQQEPHETMDQLQSLSNIHGSGARNATKNNTNTHEHPHNHDGEKHSHAHSHDGTHNHEHTEHHTGTPKGTFDPPSLGDQGASETEVDERKTPTKQSEHTPERATMSTETSEANRRVENLG